ncbi:MAG: motility associated factor glycosyltransferase family protein [Spirochaetes bacterium]|nr:motility associated factor glycosyltransferase family protein [Spirochaetota bacterium]
MNTIEFFLEPSKENYHTLRVKAEDGNFRYIHSKYHPTKESSYLQDIVNPEKYDACIILGIGLGYHLAHLANIIPFFKQIICIDINNYLTNANIPQDIQAIIHHPLVQLVFVNPDNLQQLRDTIQLQFSKGIQVIDHPASFHAFPHIFSSIKKIIQQIVDKSLSNHLTSSLFAYRYFKNALLNLNQLPECFPVAQCKGIHAHQPCIIVAPGPSLDETLFHLKKHHNCIIISVDSALKALYDHSIIPDYIVSIDPQPVVFAHLFPAQPTIPVITTLTAHPMIFSFPAIVSLNTHPVCQLLEELYPGLIGSVDSRTGTVLGDAVTFAIFAGCNPIAIAGADFSFPKCVTYARSTEYHYRYQLMHNRYTPLETKNMDYIIQTSKRTGTTIFSRKNFIQYHDALDAILPKDTSLFHINPALPLAHAKSIAIKDFLSLPQVSHYTKKMTPRLLQPLSHSININEIYTILNNETMFNTIVNSSRVDHQTSIQRIHYFLHKE